VDQLVEALTIDGLAERPFGELEPMPRRVATLFVTPGLGPRPK
jgi:hypothetical protein